MVIEEGSSTQRIMTKNPGDPDTNLCQEAPIPSFQTLLGSSLPLLPLLFYESEFAFP